MTSWDWGRHYQPSRPRPVKNGLKTRSQRGRIGETWWSERWIAFLESLDMGARLGRGRAYARRGQVMDMDVKPGLVTARVQGSRAQPYQVTIQLSPLSPQQWEKVVDVLASQALFAAKLLAGEMPQDIERAFQEARVPLFPSADKDLNSDCSCPDWANPCKHVAAVYYLLAESFDRDPFLIFLLRGQEKEGLLASLRQRRSAGASESAPTSQEQEAPPASDVPALEECLERFWAMGPEMASFRVTIAPPEVPLAVLKRLGPPPFDQAEDITETLGRAYGLISEAALRLAFESGDDGGNQ